MFLPAPLLRQNCSDVKAVRIEFFSYLPVWFACSISGRGAVLAPAGSTQLMHVSEHDVEFCSLNLDISICSAVSFAGHGAPTSSSVLANVITGDVHRIRFIVVCNLTLSPTGVQFPLSLLAPPFMNQVRYLSLNSYVVSMWFPVLLMGLCNSGWVCCFGISHCP